MGPDRQSQQDVRTLKPGRKYLFGLIYAVVLVGGIVLALQVHSMLGLGESDDTPLPLGPGRSSGPGPEDGFGDLMIGSELLTGTAEAETDPLNITGPPESRRIWARGRNDGDLQIRLAHYRVDGKPSGTVEHYRQKLSEAGFTPLGQRSDPRGRTVLPFNRNGDRAVVTLRNAPGEDKMHYVWFTAMLRTAD